MGRFSVTYILLMLRVVRRHCLVQAPGPGLTIVFLTFTVLAQGGGVQAHTYAGVFSLWVCMNLWGCLKVILGGLPTIS